MNPSEALKWAFKYRTISGLSFICGVLLFGAGLFLGFAESISILTTDGLSGFDDAIGAASPLLVLVFAVLGVVVWRIGKTFAMFLTIPTAAGTDAAEEFDTEHMKSDLLEVLDDRLSEMEAELEETRRSVQELKQAEYAAEFDEGDIPEPMATSSDSTESATVDSNDATRTGSSDATSTSANGSTSTSTSTSSASDASEQSSTRSDAASTREREREQSGTDSESASHSEDSSDPLA